MTTVLVTESCVVADGQMTGGNSISSYTTKKIVNFGGAICAGAGRWSSVKKFHLWVQDTLLAEQAQMEHPYVNISMPEKMVEEDFYGVVLYPDGTAMMFEGCDNSFEHDLPLAIGSGGDFALAAYKSNGDAKRAVEVACEMDPFSGGEIQVEEFDEKYEVPTPEKIDQIFESEGLEGIKSYLFGGDSSGEELSN